MIPFQTWLAQIVGYGSLISNRHDLQKAWTASDRSRTSVISFDELYEQVFDDLDSDAFETELESHLPVSAVARVALHAFLEGLRHVDQVRAQRPQLTDAQSLLDSIEWHQVEDAAARVVVECGPLVRTGV